MRHLSLGIKNLNLNLKHDSYNEMYEAIRLTTLPRTIKCVNEKQQIHACIVGLILQGTS